MTRIEIFQYHIGVFKNSRYFLPIWGGIACAPIYDRTKKKPESGGSSGEWLLKRYIIVFVERGDHVNGRMFMSIK